MKKRKGLKPILVQRKIKGFKPYREPCSLIQSFSLSQNLSCSQTVLLLDDLRQQLQHWRQLRWWRQLHRRPSPAPITSITSVLQLLCFFFFFLLYMSVFRFMQNLKYNKRKIFKIIIDVCIISHVEY